MKERRVDGTTMMMGRLTLYGKDGGRKESNSKIQLKRGFLCRADILTFEANLV